MALPRMVRQKGYWDPTAAINFGKAVLEWLQEQAKLLPAGSKAILRYDPERKAVLLLADDADGGADGAAADGPPDAKRRRV